MPPNARSQLSVNRSGSSFIGKTEIRSRKICQCSIQRPRCTTTPLSALHPDDTTPIPRPSHYYGRRQELDNSNGFAMIGQSTVSAAPTLGACRFPVTPAKIDKSFLTIAEPKRRRDKVHLKFVASQPCLICGRRPSDPHHLRFAQPRAIGLKVSDEFTVPPLPRSSPTAPSGRQRGGLVEERQHQCIGDRQRAVGADAAQIGGGRYPSQ